jgi:hypothetical protein
MHDIVEYAHNESFKYLVIEASFGTYYGRFVWRDSAYGGWINTKLIIKPI